MVPGHPRTRPSSTRASDPDSAHVAHRNGAVRPVMPDAARLLEPRPAGLGTSWSRRHDRVLGERSRPSPDRAVPHGSEDLVAGRRSATSWPTASTASATSLPRTGSDGLPVPHFRLRTEGTPATVIQSGCSRWSPAPGRARRADHRGPGDAVGPKHAGGRSVAVLDDGAHRRRLSSRHPQAPSVEGGDQILHCKVMAYNVRAQDLDEAQCFSRGNPKSQERVVPRLVRRAFVRNWVTRLS